jgi:hypothetical protein
MLLGEKLVKPAEAQGLPEGGAGQADPGRDAEAYRTVQQHISAPERQSASRPVPSLQAPAQVSSMSSAVALQSASPPGQSADTSPPVMEWINAVAVHDAAAGLESAPAMTANMPTAGPASPGFAAASEIASLERAIDQDPNDLDRQLRLRYLYLAEGQVDRALSLSQGMDPQRAERLLTWMRVLADAGPLIEAPQLAPEVAGRFDALAGMVHERRELHVTALELCSSIQSFGRFEAVPEGFFVAGSNNRAYVYCELSNFGSERVQDGYRVRVAHRLELLTPAGETIWQDAEPLEVVDVCRNRRTDFFFNRYWQLPSSVPAGDYVLNLVVEDPFRAQRTEAKRVLRVARPAQGR